MRFLPGFYVMLLVVMLGARAQSQNLEPLVDNGRSERVALIKEVGALLANQEFEALDRLEESLRSSKAQLPEGTSKLRAFYDGVSHPPVNSENKVSPEERAQFLARIDAWIAARPESVPAQLAHAEALLVASTYYVSTAKLSGDANLWMSYLTRARKELTGRDALLAKNPEFFRARLELSLRWGSKPAEFEKFYDRALAFDPGNTGFYIQKAEWLQMWPQSQSWMQYAEEAAHATADRFGMELYSRIIWALKSKVGFNVFDQTRASWPLAKQGFLDMEKRAPGSLWNLNAFCWFACAARDRETASALFERLGDQWSKVIWVTPAFFEAQKKWAQSTAEADQESEPVGPQVHELFARDDFEGLEKMVARMRAEKSRNIYGNWQLSYFYDGLSTPRMRNPTPQEWEAHLAKFEAWRKKLPDSATPRIALGQAWIEYAWVARGTGFADTVKDEAWDVMGGRIIRARAALDSARELQGRDAEWFHAMLRLALDDGSTREDYERLFEEATRFEPDYTPFYTAKAFYLLPRWHGVPGEWERFAAEISDRTKRPDLYTRIAWHNLAYSGEDPFGIGGLSWPKVSAGFKVILASYPDRWNLLSYCLMACKAKQREAAHELFVKVGEPAPFRPWKSRANFEAWKTWANGGPEPK